MRTLYKNSIDLLLTYQQPEGGFLACPNFSNYQYVWFRDGSFCAYALDLCGETQQADRFHQWVMMVLRRYQKKMQNCIQQSTNGILLPADECLHSRFTAEGLEIPGHWGHHQLDGLGTWVWAYEQHLQTTQQSVPQENISLLELVRDYLAALWRFPCSDCWEENENQISTHTLGAVFAGMNAIANLLDDAKAKACAEDIQKFLLEQAVVDGHLTKTLHAGEAVDANLLFLATPYEVISVDDVRFQATLSLVKKDLTSKEGGVKRYLSDTYYGGGEWLLLSACLGWVACSAGDIPFANHLLTWIESQATVDLELPEQVAKNLNNPAYLQVWTDRWGSVATPLLWSHAQYLILYHAIQNSKEQNHDQTGIL